MEKVGKVINREKHKKEKMEKAKGNLMEGNVKKSAGGGGKGSYGIIVEGGERESMDGIMGTNATLLTICTPPFSLTCLTLTHSLTRYICLFFLVSHLSPDFPLFTSILSCSRTSHSFSFLSLIRSINIPRPFLSNLPYPLIYRSTNHSLSILVSLISFGFVFLPFHSR